MLLRLNDIEDFKSAKTLNGVISEKSAPHAKGKKTKLQVFHIKVKVFFWNLSPIHWYDGFKEIKIDMSEFECKKAKGVK